MTDTYTDATANADAAYDDTATEATIFTEDDLLNSMDEDDTSELALSTLLPKGEYVIHFGNVVPVQVEGERKVRGFKAQNCNIVYDIDGGKHMNRPVFGAEWILKKDGSDNNGAETRGRMLSGMYVAAAFAEEGWTGERKDLRAMHSEAIKAMREKQEGFLPSDILRNARDFYCIGYVKLEEANGEYDASNKLSLVSLKPITPTLLQIIMRYNQG